VSKYSASQDVSLFVNWDDFTYEVRNKKHGAHNLCVASPFTHICSYNSSVYTMHYALHFDGDDVTDLSVEVSTPVLFYAVKFVTPMCPERFKRMLFFHGLGRPCTCASGPVLQAHSDAREHWGST
jgi:hypothetical protein